MKQLLQSPAGAASIEDLPPPMLRPGMLLVRNAASLVSAGTERMVVEFSRKSLVEKARARPDLVRKVVDKARTDGVLSAWDATRARFDQPLVLGYSCAGTVLAVGEGVHGFEVGDRVACAGAGYASHAEIIAVPRNLVAKVPPGLSLEHAAFATVGAIGLHGLRLAEPQLGETVAVIGLGLIGLLIVQLAKGAGLNVIGIDLDAARVALAGELGADVALVNDSGDGALAAARSLSDGLGADIAIVAAASSSSAPLELAAKLCRDRGRVILVGAVGMDLPRGPFFEKELSFRVSRSYGPGRYDPSYELDGIDYPVGYVRWTENRNLGAVLEQAARGVVRLEPLVTHRFDISDAARAYDLITSAGEPALGVIINYPDAAGQDEQPRGRCLPASATAPTASSPGIGLIGAGNFAMSTLLPAMSKVSGLEMVGVCTATGVSSRRAAAKFGFRYATSEETAILGDPDVSLVAIVTRHDLHARQIAAALNAGKHVFCEKPPAIDEGGLADVVRAHVNAGDRLLAVGYNRRFAPMARTVKNAFSKVSEPLIMHARVNGGFIPSDNWVQDASTGGGRIIGEACHFFDLLTYFAGSLPVSVSAIAAPDGSRYSEDNVAITLQFGNGAVGTIAYVAAGHRGLGKERFEVFGGGVSAAIDDWRRVEIHSSQGRHVERSRLRQDKGHRAEWTRIVQVLKEGGEPPISLESLVATSLATFAAVRSLRSGDSATVDARAFVERAAAVAAAAAHIG